MSAKTIFSAFLCILYVTSIGSVVAANDGETIRYITFFRGYFDKPTRAAILHDALSANLHFCRSANVDIEWRRNERLVPYSNFDVLIVGERTKSCVETLNASLIERVITDQPILGKSRRSLHINDLDGTYENTRSTLDANSRVDATVRYVDARCETGADVLWRIGARAQRVRVAVFDTGLRRSSRYPNVVDITNWTNEPSADDEVGHGTFTAGLIGASTSSDGMIDDVQHSRCGPLAPHAIIYVMKVFNSAHVSFTSWFLDAFNYALARRVHLINLSIGGPDYADLPFVDKVRELAANRVLLVSAIGNDGPLFGTLNNPADHPEVLGVGALELTGPSRTALLAARSRSAVETDQVLLADDEGTLQQIVETNAQRKVAQRPPQVSTSRGHSSFNHSRSKLDRRSLVTDFWNVARFSSRGMSMWQIGDGSMASYGRVKPDLLALGVNVAGRALDGGCRVLSGSSVASALTAGVVALLYGVTLNNRSTDGLVQGGTVNPAFLKQILLSTARRSANERAFGLDSASTYAGFSTFEQGAGAIDVLAAARFAIQLEPQVTLMPAAIDLTDCPYFWPLCIDPLFHTRLPLAFNVTVLNSIGMLSDIERADVYTTDRYARRYLQVAVSHTDMIWPFAGHFGVFLSATSHAENWTGVVTAFINITVRTYIGPEVVRQVVTLPVRVRVVPKPDRSRRLLFDMRHSIKYPPAYVPRDNLLMRNDPLDWNGDHPHSNLIDWFVHLRENGYFVEVLQESFDCFDAALYGALVLFDSEADFSEPERQKLVDDVTQRGLSLLVVADWYNVSVMRALAFAQQSQQGGSVPSTGTGAYRASSGHNVTWYPVTSGANVPALNDLLSSFGVSFGDTVLHGELAIRDKVVQDQSENESHAGEADTGVAYVDFESGTELVSFPGGGYLLLATLEDQGSQLLQNSESEPTLIENVPILGLLQTGDGLDNISPNSGRVVTFGDSNCLDSAHNSRHCFPFFDWLLEYAMLGRIAEPLAPLLVSSSDYSFATSLPLPSRPSWQPHLPPSAEDNDCQSIAFQPPSLLDASFVQRRELRDVYALFERGWSYASRLNLRVKTDLQLTASEKYFLAELRRLESAWYGDHSLVRPSSNLNSMPARRHLDAMDVLREANTSAPGTIWVLLVFFSYVTVFCFFLVFFVRKRQKSHSRQTQRATSCSVALAKLRTVTTSLRNYIFARNTTKQRRNPFGLPSPKATWLRSNVLRVRNLTRRTRSTPDRDRDRERSHENEQFASAELELQSTNQMDSASQDASDPLNTPESEQFRTVSPNYVYVDDEIDADREAGRSPSPSYS